MSAGRAALVEAKAQAYWLARRNGLHDVAEEIRDMTGLGFAVWLVRRLPAAELARLEMQMETVLP